MIFRPRSKLNYLLKTKIFNVKNVLNKNIFSGKFVGLDAIQ